jgi:prolipoprotein diacylglyceryl transferase
VTAAVAALTASHTRLLAESVGGDPLAAIGSPTTAVWHVGPFPIRAYALCIMLGIIAAVAITELRLRRRGGPPFAALDIAIWAIPFGILGARVYHVITTPQPYFGENGDPLGVFQLWNGGLGIWGSIIGGAFGAWIGAKRRGIPLAVVADCLAPGLPVAQAIGRFGNWFNNELYGKPTDLPWALRIYDIDPATGAAVKGANGQPDLVGLFHPTFAYEALWCLGAAALVFWFDRWYRVGRGRLFALYCALYVVGRAWIEALRIDPANDILGLRLNIWTCLIVFIGAVTYMIVRRGPKEILSTDQLGRVTVTYEGEEPAKAPEPVAEEPEAKVSVAKEPEKEPADEEPAKVPADEEPAKVPAKVPADEADTAVLDIAKPAVEEAEPEPAQAVADEAETAVLDVAKPAVEEAEPEPARAAADEAETAGLPAKEPADAEAPVAEEPAEIAADESDEPEAAEAEAAADGAAEEPVKGGADDEGPGAAVESAADEPVKGGADDEGPGAAAESSADEPEDEPEAPAESAADEPAKPEPGAAAESAADEPAKSGTDEDKPDASADGAADEPAESTAGKSSRD